MKVVLQLCYAWRYKGNNFQMDRCTGKSGGKMQREESPGPFVQLQSIVVFKCLLPPGAYCIQCSMTNSKTFSRSFLGLWDENEVIVAHGMRQRWQQELHCISGVALYLRALPSFSPVTWPAWCPPFLSCILCSSLSGTQESYRWWQSVLVFLPHKRPSPAPYN